MTISYCKPGKGKTEKFTLGVYTISATYGGDFDYNVYSKAYHRRYGPTFVPSINTVTFTREWGCTTRSKTVEIDSWRGHWLVKAIELAGLGATKHNAPKKVYLNATYGVKPMSDEALAKSERIKDHKYYTRTLLGVDVDHCVVSPKGMTFHSDFPWGLHKGLERKQKEAIESKNRKVSKALGLKLGFCSQGMADFAELIEVNIDDRLSVDQIISKIDDKNYANFSHYQNELKILFRACKTTWPANWN